MAFFGHNELKYYSFGLRAGVSNFLSNGLALGSKKTIGKISQPINSHSRFPEYHYFDAAIRNYMKTSGKESVRILDVGSPKLFGFYLACTTRASVHLTDISELNVDEYRGMWQSLRGNAIGNVSFSLEDARQLSLPDASFDVVYSMSVLEHVEAGSDDSSAIGELMRVLKPGGLLILSVPFGTRYVEQQRVGFARAVQRTEDGKAYFFQRIYDWPAFQHRVVDQAGGLEEITFATIWRKRPWLSRTLNSLGENVRGALGIFNPLVSALVNESHEGVNRDFVADYANVQNESDVYGDLVMKGRKGFDGLNVV